MEVEVIDQYEISTHLRGKGEMYLLDVDVDNDEDDVFCEDE
jgi:hypothetical protein